MHTRTLGQGLEVSAVGLGCMGMSQSYGPNPGSRDAIYAAFVSTISPSRISVPIERISAFMRSNVPPRYALGNHEP